jgi:hypothetical protein
MFEAQAASPLSVIAPMTDDEDRGCARPMRALHQVAFFTI